MSPNQAEVPEQNLQDAPLTTTDDQNEESTAPVSAYNSYGALRMITEGVECEERDTQRGGANNEMTTPGSQRNSVIKTAETSHSAGKKSSHGTKQKKSSNTTSHYSEYSVSKLFEQDNLD